MINPKFIDLFPPSLKMIASKAVLNALINSTKFAENLLEQQTISSDDYDQVQDEVLMLKNICFKIGFTSETILLEHYIDTFDDKAKIVLKEFENILKRTPSISSMNNMEVLENLSKRNILVYFNDEMNKIIDFLLTPR